MSYTNYHYMLDAFVAVGLKHIFVYPGHSTIAFLDILEQEYQDKIKMVVCSSESEAMGAADAYGRIVGFAVVIVTYGVGALNTTNFATHAAISNSPVLIISGSPTDKEMDHPPVWSSAGYPDVYLDAFESLGIPSFTVYDTDMELIPDLLIRISEESTPLYIEIAPDVGLATVEEEFNHPLIPFSPVSQKILDRRFTFHVGKQVYDTNLAGPLKLSNDVINELPSYYMTADVGEASFAASQIMEYIELHSRYITPLPWVSMGMALPYSIGVAFARQASGHEDQGVIAITGDGSFRLSLMSLTTINRYHLPIKVIVIDNDGFETEKYLSDNAPLAEYNALPKISINAVIAGLGVTVFYDISALFSGNSFGGAYVIKTTGASPRMRWFCEEVIRKNIE